MKSLGHIFLGIILGCILFYFMRGCGEGGGVRVDTTYQVKYDTVKLEGDTVWTQLSPDTIYRDTGTSDTFFIDTGKVVADYFNRRFYKRSFTDSNFRADIKAQVWRNRLDSLSLDYGLNYTEKTITETITKQNEVSFVPGVTLGLEYIEPNVRMRYQEYQFGVGRTFDGNWRLHLGYTLN